MMTNELQKLITRQYANQPTQTFDWEPRRTRWVAELTALFARITQDLEDAGVESDAIDVQSLTISEDQSLGLYEAPLLKVKLPQGVVQFRPVASVIVGGYGRIDATGPANQHAPVRLIALDADDESGGELTPPEQRAWAWKVFVDRSKPRVSMPLDTDSLAQLLRVCLGDD